MDHFKLPQKFIERSQARQAKIRENQEIRNEAMANNINQITYDGTTPIKTSSSHERISRGSPKLGKKRDIKVNAVSSPSKAVLEVEKLKRQREERRQKQTDMRLLRQTLDPAEATVLQFKRDISQFRSNFAAKNGNGNAGQTVSKDILDVMEEEHSLPRIRVCVRKRPLKKTDKASTKKYDCISTVDKGEGKRLFVHEQKQKVDQSQYLDNLPFRFDNVYDETVSNDGVYGSSIQPLVKELFEGGKVSVFAYGQTGSGKTHTIFGPEDGSIPGVYDYASEDIFKLLHHEDAPESYQSLQLWACFYEIYGGQIYDLFQNRRRLRLLEDKHGDVQIMELREIPVCTLEDLQMLHQVGRDERSTSSTNMNATSSRSHAIFQLNLREEYVVDDVTYAIPGPLYGSMTLIDLAGSERASHVNHDNPQLRLEGADINKSLLGLKECIRALHKGSSHVPFRASKLTQVLRDVIIAENAYTVMMATVNPISDVCDHTLNTLRYANRIKEYHAPSGSHQGSPKLSSKRSTSATQLSKAKSRSSSPLVSRKKAPNVKLTPKSQRKQAKPDWNDDWNPSASPTSPEYDQAKQDWNNDWNPPTSTTHRGNEPEPTRKESGTKQEDLAMVYDSLAVAESKQLLTLHCAAEALIEAEEKLANTHQESLQACAEIQEEEQVLLNAFRERDMGGGKLEVEDYVERMELLLSKKMRIISGLYVQVSEFKESYEKLPSATYKD